MCGHHFDVHKVKFDLLKGDIRLHVTEIKNHRTGIKTDQTEKS